VAATRQSLGEAAWTRAFDAGRALAPDEAIGLALEGGPSSSAPVEFHEDAGALVSPLHGSR